MEGRGAQGEEKCCFCSVKPRKADQYGPFVPGSDVKRADREVSVAGEAFIAAFRETSSARSDTHIPALLDL